MGLPAPLLVPLVLPWLAGPEPPQVAPAVPGLQLWPAPGEGAGEGEGEGAGARAQLCRVGSQAVAAVLSPVKRPQATANVPSTDKLLLPKCAAGAARWVV